MIVTTMKIEGVTGGNLFNERLWHCQFKGWLNSRRHGRLDTFYILRIFYLPRFTRLSKMNQ